MALKASETGGRLARLRTSLGETRRKDVHKIRLLSVQQCITLRIVLVYHTVSQSTSLILAGTPPIYLLTQERKEAYHEIKEIPDDPKEWEKIAVQVKRTTIKAHSEVAEMLGQRKHADGCIGSSNTYRKD